jgi:ABC-2 type transport system ATP-binding protein
VTSSIQAIDLNKTFGSIPAVTRLSLEVHAGEIFGLVGPDAAGKTTTLRMLCGILSPDAGTATVAGCDITTGKELLKQRVGYLPQRFGLYGDLTVLENIDFYADLYEVGRKARKARVEKLLQFAALAPFGKRKAQDLSGGMKQKLGLICALIHTPQVLFLDEPTTGVDPVSRKDFWIILYDLLRQGVTVLFSTSYLDEAERCNRVGLMYQGRLLVADHPSAIKGALRGTILEVRTNNNQKAMKIVRGLTMVRNPVLSGDKVHVLVQDAEAGERAIREVLAREGMKAFDLTAVRPSLEDAFVAIVQEQGQGRQTGSEEPGVSPSGDS